MIIVSAADSRGQSYLRSGRMWDGANAARELIASLRSREGDLIDICQKCGVKTVDHVAQANGQANIDNLLRAEVLGESSVGFIVDGNISGRALRVTHDCRLRLRVNPSGQRVIAKITELIFCQADAPTEHRMGGNSIVATIDDSCRCISQFRLLSRQASTTIDHRTKVSELL